MLKHLSIIFSFFLTACTNSIFTSNTSSSQHQNSSSTQHPTQSSSVERNYFVGLWACEMNGGNIGSSNTVQLAQDGYVSYLGTFTIPKEDPLFQYQLERIGTWAFASDILTYQFNKSSFTRAHTFEMLKKIKTDKNLNAEENTTFDGLSAQMNNSSNRPISLEVSNFTDQSFVITQKLPEITRTGICQRIVK